MTPEQIKSKYESRILSVLNSIREAVTEAGHHCGEPFDLSDDCFRWQMVVDGDEDCESGIDITFTIAESESFDGEENGVNFMMDVVEFGGRILGGLIPYNYSSKVWVNRDDERAIEERFLLMERADSEGIVNCLKEGSRS